MLSRDPFIRNLEKSLIVSTVVIWFAWLLCLAIFLNGNEGALNAVLGVGIAAILGTIGTLLFIKG